MKPEKLTSTPCPKFNQIKQCIMATQPTNSTPNRRMTLYSYFRSSCSTRVRFALHLKGLNHLITYKYVDCARDEHLKAEYEQMSLSNTLPCLVIYEFDGEEHDNIQAGIPKSRTTITQSLAILEYLEELFPDTTPHLIPPPSLLVSSSVEEKNVALLKRAQIKNLALVVVADWQPLANLSPVRHVTSLALEYATITHSVPGSEEGKTSDVSQVIDGWLEWSHTRGLKAYERYARSTAGRYSVGDELTLADIVLVPAVENWVRGDWGRKIEVLKREYPNIYRIFENTRELDAYKKAHWTAQSDNKVGLNNPVFNIGGTAVQK
ncbi:hypothetical protein TSTA_102490 [Talaromyces stipitatus ATCC 10500]|uniref:Maleylacetoacetate isomerase n=1 Tax=Talaromyces stipitatus (strain ATCC 10500 / CBS 375.48 / QM 6759 / NRRL 1006) TaxID=441959 RepID=B8MND0_TALSN|nr:uncharacterized protein TSTA_102490 [Talaromyces stipitatus ATCC 10500]EED14019.1 hypothetical protein TSTA_102490 [Talaromyces stipitatus ATCC 10500]